MTLAQLVGAFFLATNLFTSVATAEPVLLDEQFKLPPTFTSTKLQMHASATVATTLRSTDRDDYSLVGDGKAVRRLTDSNGDHVYDKQEVMAEGLGGRGPQGLLVYGDRLVDRENAVYRIAMPEVDEQQVRDMLASIRQAMFTRRPITLSSDFRETAMR